MSNTKRCAHRLSKQTRHRSLRLLATLAIVTCAAVVLTIGRQDSALKSTPTTGRSAAESHRLPVASRTALTAIQRAPFRFKSNKGQTDKNVRFLARTGDSTLFLTSNEAVIVRRQ